MKAGRELDALVAEKVMGMVVSKDQVTRWIFAEPRPDDPWEYFLGTSNDKIPAYSADISAAWEVAEKLRAHRIIIMISSDEDGGWEVDMWDYNLRKGAALSESVPHAICLAALQAMGVEFPEV